MDELFTPPSKSIKGKQKGNPRQIDSSQNIRRVRREGESASRKLADFNFRIDPDLRKRFKIQAAVEDLPMRELLEKIVREYLDQTGS